jgi:hypothetical protein
VTPPATFAGPRGELDMWHPTGAPRRRLALGHYAGESDCEDAGPIDLAIIAPSPLQAGPDWLERAIALAARRLGEGGVLWIIVPRRRRGTAERSLGRCQLVLLDAVLAIPPWPRSAHLVPLAPAAVRDAGPRHLGLPRAVAWSLGSLVGVGAGRRLLARMAPSCALVAAREPWLPMFRWLGDLDGTGVATATVSSGPRRDARVAVALRFRPHRRSPDLVVKTALDQPGVERVQAERAALERFGPTAAAAGAVVPVPKPCSCPWVLATDPLVGRSGAAVLASAPRRLLPVAGTVADWLARWNAATASRAVASAEVLEELVVGPVRRLVADGAVSAPYAQAMAMLAARLEGRDLVWVAAHSDLTMGNVLATSPAPGIMDWESATAAGLPLVDLWYALADGVACAGRVTHASAVEALVTGTAPAPSTLARIPAQHATALRLTVDETILAFHVCWLGHADDELRRGVSDRQFADVVRAVAARRLLWPQRS